MTHRFRDGTAISGSMGQKQESIYKFQNSERVEK